MLCTFHPALFVMDNENLSRTVRPKFTYKDQQFNISYVLD